jgi:hypothetical protein
LLIVGSFLNAHRQHPLRETFFHFLVDGSAASTPPQFKPTVSPDFQTSP